jgi:ABC-type antimicrobial peptide transport system permease subunit
LLYGIEPIDAPTFAAATALLVGAAMLSAYIPARQVSRVDPSTALRE